MLAFDLLRGHIVVSLTLTNDTYAKPLAHPANEAHRLHTHLTLQLARCRRHRQQRRRRKEFAFASRLRLHLAYSWLIVTSPCFNCHTNSSRSRWRLLRTVPHFACVDTLAERGAESQSRRSLEVAKCDDQDLGTLFCAAHVRKQAGTGRSRACHRFWLHIS